MADWANPFRNIEFAVRPSPKKLKIVLFALILTCVTALVMLGMVRRGIQQQTQAALDQAAALEQENAELSGRDDKITPNDIREIAQGELGLVDPDTIIIDPNS